MKKIYIIAVVAALLSAVLLYGFLNSYDKKNGGDSDVNYNTAKVVVAAEDIPANTTIKDKMVKVVEIPIDGIHPDAARERIDVVGLVTKSDLVADEQIIKSKFVSGKDGGAALSYQIADGKRAMSVSVENWSGVAGYIEKGDLVDVIAVIPAEPKQDVKTDDGENLEVVGRVSSVVIESAKVLEVGDVGYVASALEVYKSLTLELSQEQCAKLAAAQNMGTITVALRNKADNRVLRKGPYSSKKMLKN